MPVCGSGGQVFLYVIADEFLDFAVLGIGIGDDILAIFVDQRLARREHLRANQIEGGPG